MASGLLQVADGAGDPDVIQSGLTVAPVELAERGGQADP
jgi:hypothetical protein